MLIYTSGSTGKPKGVQVSHDNLLNSTLARAHYYERPVYRYLLMSSISFDSSVAGIFWTLATGGALLLPGEGQQRDGREVVGLADQHRASHILCLPSLYRTLLEIGGENLASTLEVAIVAGEKCAPEVASQHRKLLTGTRLYNEYGPTEGSVWSTVFECGGDLEGAVPIGRPIVNTRSYVVDSFMRPAIMGQPGEIYIGGEGITRGYARKPDLTAERFIPDWLSGEPGARLYRTGDLGTLSRDGNIEYLGRQDQEVKIRGYRIELGEIEAILNGHEDVRESVLEAIEFGGEKRLVAYIVGQREGRPDKKEIREYLQRKLPDYMVPWKIMGLTEIPLSQNGKLDRKRLPSPEETGRGENVQAATSPAEGLLTGIWEEVLKRERIGVEENFFEAGGHSLLAMRVMTRIKHVFGAELPVRALFESPTIRGLARDIEAKRRVEQHDDEPIKRARRDRPLPLSFAQQRLWFVNQLHPDSSAYDMPFVMRIRGPLDVSLLRQSLLDVVERHEALRTRFVARDGRPQQVIDELEKFELPSWDISDSEQDEREQRAREIIRLEAGRPFDLEQGPVWRAALVRLGREDYVFLLCLHHVVSDGWSMGVLANELTELYAGYREGRRAVLPELAIQYADYAVWQREWLRGEVLEQQLSYWRRQLDGARVLELPTDRPRPAVASHQGAVLPFTLPAELSYQLRQMSRQQGVTMFMTLLAAFQVVLSRHSGQDDVVVGTDVANRNRVETESLIGFFINQLVLRTDLSADPTFEQLLESVRETTLSAYQHQDLPFEKLVEELQPERDLGRSPLFQVKLVLQNAPRGEMRAAGVEFSGFGAGHTIAKFDITLFMTESNDGVGGIAEYATDLYEGTSIERLMGHLRLVIEAMLREPRQVVSEVSLLSESEKQQLAVEWNDTARGYEEGLCLHELFERQARSTPDAVAVVYESQQLSYDELNHRAESLASYLRSMAVGPEALVAVCMERSLEMVIGLLGVLKAGAAYVPMDPSYPAERLAYMLEDSGAEILLTQRRVMSETLGYSGEVLCLDEEWSKDDKWNPIEPKQGAQADNLAYVIYTSGSTGQPKGAMNTHRAIVNRLLWMQEMYSLGADDRVLQKTTFSFDVSVWEFFWPLLTGAALVMARPGGHGDPQYLRDVMESERITTLHFVPSMLEVFLDQEGWRRCETVSRVISSGEALPAKLATKFYNLGASCLHNLYGPTEAAVDVTYRRCEENENGPTVPIGRPISNTQIYLVDKRGQLAPESASGELYIGGTAVGRGYWNRADLTAERFIPDGHSGAEGSRVYLTGDLARWGAGGEVEYLSRIDNQVKVRGYRIELGEIEAVLRKHEAVKQCAVAIRGNQAGGKQVVGYVVLAEGATATAAELREHVMRKLPGYMVPSAIVELSELPLTPNGKLDRKALPAPAAANDVGEEPRSPVEEILCSIWADVLQAESVGRQQNFFGLGGHSLLATQVVLRVREAFNVEVGLKELFERPTVAGLAETIEQERGAGRGAQAPPIVAVSRDGELPLSFAQQRLWFIHQLEPDGAAYNMPISVMLKGRLEVAALSQSLQAIAQRHEVLRTRYVAVDGNPHQLIEEEAELEIKLYDLSDLEDGHREQEARAITGREAGRAFDLEQGPVWRAGLVKLTQEEHVLMLTIHHIASDGWSTGVLVREFSALYEQYSSGRQADLPELRVQYADFAVWQREWLSGEVLEQHLSYWRNQLKDAQALDLPTDRPRPAVASHRGAAIPFRLPASLTDRLRQVSRHQGVTMFMTLLAAFQVVLSKYSGQDDVVVGTDVANRNRLETEPLIGFFINQLVLRTDLSANPTFEQLLASVRETTLGAYQHQDVPFEKLVDELHPKRDLGRSPLFQVKLDLQNAPREELRMSGIKFGGFGADHRVAKLDLTIAMVEGKEGVSGTAEYATELYEGTSIERLLGYVEMVAEAMVEDSLRPIGEVVLLSESQRHQVLVEWNDTADQAARELARATLPELFDTQTQITPDAVAVVCDLHHLTYRRLNATANQLANHLLTLGVSPDHTVAICLDRSADMLAAMLGVLKAGGAYLPLDPTYPTDRVEFMLEDAGVELLVTQQGYASVAPESAARMVLLDRDREVIGRQSTSSPGVEIDPDNLAYVIYTSGSTGEPKGVGIAHSNAAAFLSWAHGVFGEDCRGGVLASTSICFDLSVFELFGPLCLGGRIVLADNALALAGIADGVRLINTVPSAAQGLLDGGGVPGSVRAVNLAGEALGGELVRRLYREAGVERVYNLYGPTETTTYSTYVLVGDEEGVEPTIGRAVGNTQVRLVSGAGMEAVAMGASGEICIGGLGVARGYLRRADLTAERFVPDGYGEEAGGRMYRTGDVGRQRDRGEVEYIGRRDNQVKVRGYRIELGEIEAVLRKHEAVKQCAVAIRGNQAGGKQVVGYVVLADAAAATAAELREHVMRKLPGYMVPSAIVELSELPLTPNGKLDRKRLPDPRLEAGPGSYEPPRTQVERVLCHVWEKVLGVEKVGIRDNFFELGGDSILSIQLIARARKAGLRLTPKQFFQHQCIAELAQVAEQAGDGAGQQVSAEQGLLVGEFGLTPIQQEFFSRELAEENYYNQAVMLELKAGTASGPLEQAVSALLLHHDSLRLSYSRRAGNWVQCYGEAAAGGHYLRRDLSRLTESQQKQAMREDARRVQASLDVSQGQIVRLVEYELGAAGRRLMMVIHHLAIDGVSWRILLEDLERVYGQTQKGEPAWPGEKTTSYRQWAECLSQYASTRKAIEAARYWVGSRWEQAWRGMAVDDQGADNKVRATRNLTKYVSQQQTDSLLKLVAAAYQTQINEVLVTALGLAYRRWSGEASLVIEMEGHGREDEFEAMNVTRTVGWFTTAFPVIVEVGRGGAVEALRRVRQQLRRVPARGLTYGVVKYLSPLHQQEAELEGVINEIRKQGRAQISFNYLGQVDQVLWESELFRAGEQGAGATQGGDNERGVELEVTGIVANGRLKVDWKYAAGRHREERIRELAEYFEEGIRELIEGAEQRIRQVEQISREYAGEVEWVYELSPMQQGMLFHTLYEPGQGAYFEQMSCLMNGELDEEAFRKSWEAIVNRHEILRTTVRWDLEGEPLQVVHRRMAGVWQQADWRGKSRHEQARMLDEYLEEDRRKGFDLSKGPLMRVVLIKVGEKRSYLVWSSHHALYDGWSKQVLLEEVFQPL